MRGELQPRSQPIRSGRSRHQGTLYDPIRAVALLLRRPVDLIRRQGLRALFFRRQPRWSIPPHPRRAAGLLIVVLDRIVPKSGRCAPDWRYDPAVRARTAPGRILGSVERQRVHSVPGVLDSSPGCDGDLLAGSDIERYQIRDCIIRIVLELELDPFVDRVWLDNDLKKQGTVTARVVTFAELRREPCLLRNAGVGSWSCRLGRSSPVGMYSLGPETRRLFARSLRLASWGWRRGTTRDFAGPLRPGIAPILGPFAGWRGRRSGRAWVPAKRIDCEGDDREVIGFKVLGV